MSILDVDSNLGVFDYILCHGVYSWVPPEVQRKILEIGNQNLSPSGLMCVSYNVLPGWHIPRVMRDAMRFHVEQFDKPAVKIAEARAFLQFLASNVESDKATYDKLIQAEASFIQTNLAKLDYYLYHEFLEGLNQPLYFREFLEACQRAGLSYVADTTLRNLLACPVDPALPAPWSEGSLTEREQLSDYLTCRRFRRSILCQASRTPDQQLDPSRLESLAISFRTPVRIAYRDGKITRWTNHRTGFASTSPLTEIFECIHEAFPAWIPIHRLLEDIEAERRGRILEALLNFTAQGITQLSFQPIEIAQVIPTRPRALAYTRYRAATGQAVANLRHSELELTAMQRFVLRQLDGHHTSQQLANSFQAAIDSGKLSVKQPGARVQLTSEQCLHALEKELDALRRMAFILAD